MRAGRAAVALAALAVAGTAAGVASATTGPARASATGSPPVTATVVEEALASQLTVDGTLGYAGSYDVLAPAAPSGDADTGDTDPSSGPDDPGEPTGSGSTGCPASPSTSTTTTTPPSTTTTTATTTTTVPSTTTTAGPTTTVPTTTTPTTTKGSRPTSSPVPGTGTTVPGTTTTTTPRGRTPSGGCSPHAGSQPSSHPTAPSTPGASGQPSDSGQPPAGAETFTALPAVGQTVTEGHSLYAVDGAPVVLLYGPVPAWRALSPGVTGSDVAELDVDLVALGYATEAQVPAGSDVFTPATGRAVRALQAALGQSQTGTLSLGQVVFLPTAARVTSVAATVGGTVTAGAQVLQATSTSRSVTVSLDAARQLELAAGDAVTITLPDGRTTPGVVSAVGTTATPGSSNGPPGSSPGPTTVQVAVTPLDPGATGTLDQAPVTVTVTTATVPPALAVPVAALVSTSTGTPALRLTGPGRSTRLRPVMTGIVDDATGMVQVSGPGLRAGQRVVLPGSGAAG